MTTTGDEHARQHPTADQLAEFAEGIGNAATDIHGHAAQCSECQEKLASFAAVKTVLRTANTAVPTPPDVSARITAALANAADQRAGEAERETELAQGGPVAWFRRRLPRALAATASIAVIGLAGYAAVMTNSGGTDDGAAGESAVNDAAPEEQAEEAPSDLEAGGDAMRDEALAESSLDAAVIEIWQTRSTFGRPDCGSRIAAETGETLVGSVEYGDDVLVVLEVVDGDELQGWVIPTCASLTAEAIESVSVPVPTR